MKSAALKWATVALLVFAIIPPAGFAVAQELEAAFTIHTTSGAGMIRADRYFFSGPTLVVERRGARTAFPLRMVWAISDPETENNRALCREAAVKNLQDLEELGKRMDKILGVAMSHADRQAELRAFKRDLDEIDAHRPGCGQVSAAFWQRNKELYRWKEAAGLAGK
jgi:hypothetical protein